jgi:autotransporter-associated beta strand protein
MAVLAAFAGSAEPDGTDFVVTADAGESYTYSTAIGNYARLVKRGAGEVVLTAATTAFAGDVLVEEGTLSITVLGALGTTSPVTVESGATFYLKTPHGSGQTVGLFNKHKLTIAGDGVDGKGAIRYLPSNGGANDDSLLGTIDLTADATIECDYRWGVYGGNNGVINLNGHKLRRICNDTGGSQWMLNNCTVNGAGTLEAYKGMVTFQGAVKSSADVTYVATNTGKYYVWATSGSNPSAFTFFPGQTFEVGSGSAANNNHFSGPIHLSNHAGLPGGGVVTFGVGSPKVLYLDGPMTGDAGTNAASGTTLTTSGSGSLFLNGDVLLRRNTYLNGGTLVAMTSTASRVFSNGFIVNGSSRALIGGGRTLLNWIRVGNGANKGTVHQTGGVLGVKNDTFIGESASGVSHWMMSGGEAYVSNVVYVGHATNSFGSFLQTGGSFRGRSGNFVMYAGRAGVGVYHQSGGTNDSLVSRVGQITRFRVGYFGGPSEVTVSGTGTVMKTEFIYFGSTGQVSTNIFNINDGGVVGATRLGKSEAVGAAARYIMNFDGGTLMPLFGHGWCAVGPTDAKFYQRALTHCVIWKKGLVIDTSDSSGSTQDGQPSGVAASHMPLHFESPTGKGVESVSFPTTGNYTNVTYYGPARVVFEDETGWGASAYAVYDYETKKHSRIIVTSRGCNYSDNAKAYIESPGRTALYECALTLSDNADHCGELVKRGAQSLHLYATNTLAGGIAVESGTLVASTVGVVPSNTPVRVEAGATMQFTVNRPTVLSTFTGAGSVTGCDITVTNAVRASCADLFANRHATFAGNLTFAPGATFTITDPENLEAYAKSGSRIAFTASAVSGTPTVAFEGEPPQGVKWSLFKKDDMTYNFGAIVGTMLLLK